VKRKQIVLLIVTTLILIVTCAALTENTEAAMDENSFLQEFLKALQSKDQAVMKEVVKQGEAIVYKVVMLFAEGSIKKIAEANEASNYFKAAEIIAEVYFKEFKKKALIELVRIYAQYTQEMYVEGLKGDGLIE
jgi:hypothetical protein